MSDSTPSEALDGAASVLDALFTALPDPCAILRADGRISQVNDAFQAAFGAADWASRSLNQLLVDEIDQHAAPWRPGASIRSAEVSVRRSNGSVVAARARRIPGPDGQTGILFKLDERDPASPFPLDDARRRLSDVFAETSVGAFGLNLTTGDGQVSGFLARYFDLPKGDPRITVERWRDAIHPDDREQVFAALSTAKGQLYANLDLTVRLREAATGGYRWMRHVVQVAALDAAGLAAQITGSVSDVTDMMRIAAARDSAEARVDLAVDVAELSFWRHEFDTGAGALNGPAAEVYEPGRGFCPAGWRNRVHPDDVNRLAAAFDGLQFGGRLDESFRVHTPSGAWRRHRAVGQLEGDRRTLLAASGFIRDLGPADSASLSAPDADEAAHSAQMSAWSYDLRTRRMALSGPIVQRLGYPGPEHELAIEDWRALVLEADYTAMDHATVELMSEGVTEVEYRVQPRTGEAIWVNLRGGVSEQDAEGAPLRFSGFFAEVSDRKELERQLAKREQQLADAVEASLLGIWTYDYRTEQQTARGRLLSWMGLPPDSPSVSGEDWRAITHPDDRDITRQAHITLISGNPVEAFDYRIKSPTGWRWARVQGRPVDFDAKGDPLRAAGVVLDVTAERAFAEALLDEQARFEVVFRSAPAMLHTLDAEGRTVLISDYWLKRLGYSVEEAMGRPGWEFFLEDDAERIRTQVFPHVVEYGSIENVPLTAVCKSGERVEVRLSAFLERDADGAPVAAHGVFNDVTDLNSARRKLEAHAAALERTNRELNRFATVASHDLQEPLRKISAFASLLRRRYEGRLDPDADQSLDYLVDAAGRMRTLIDDLLAYSRASNRQIEPRPIDLAKLMADLINGFELQIQDAGAQLEVGDLPVITGDETLIQLLFQNLLSNALKYRQGAGVKIQVTAEPTEDGWRVAVSDDGIGFDPKFAEKVFAPFQRLHTRDEYAGTGIGLAICQQAVERHGGEIWVETAPGEGARFLFTLPNAQALNETAA